MAKRNQSNGQEIYVAKAGAEAALAAEAAAPFTIKIVFLGGLTDAQKDVFKFAADRWVKIIVGDLPDVMVNNEVIDDLLIEAQGIEIDGPNNILGQAGATVLRPASSPRGTAFLPAKGKMSFDKADLAVMEAKGILKDVITHEMGHVLGIGIQVWQPKGLLKRAGSINPTFIGANAMKEFGILKGTAPTPVPVENMGPPGTRDTHWRESVFDRELMTGIAEAEPPMPISRVTVASLKDLGYVVDFNGADPFSLSLPSSLLALAESGRLAAAVEARAADGMVLPILPTVLPADSLQ